MAGEKVVGRMAELIAPIDQQIYMCDNDQDLLMLACLLVERGKEILDQQLSVEGRMEIFKDYLEE